MKRLLITLILLVLLLTGMLVGTDPANLPAYLLIIPFLLLLVIVWLASFLQLCAMGFSRFRSIRLSLVVSGLPVGLLLLQSIGQLTVRDVITILTFFGLAYFYIARITSTSE